MTEYYLTCNVVQCRKELKLKAWTTTCSHIFCTTHGESACEKRCCLACGVSLSNRYDIIIMDLNPSEKHRNMILSGLNPETALDIMSRSIRFWSYQVYHEKVLKDGDCKAAIKYSDELTDYCETLMSNHKIQVQKLQREKQNLQKELSETTVKIEELVGHVAEKSRLIKDLQSQCDSMKRAMYNYMHNADCGADDPATSLNETTDTVELHSRKHSSIAANKAKIFKFEPMFYGSG